MPSRASLSKVWGSLGSSGRGLTWVLVVVVVVAVVLLVWWGCRKQVERFTLSDTTSDTTNVLTIISTLVPPIFNPNNPDCTNYIQNLNDAVNVNTFYTSTSTIQDASNSHGLLPYIHNGTAFMTFLNNTYSKYSFYQNGIFVGIPMKQNQNTALMIQYNGIPYAIFNTQRSTSSQIASVITTFLKNDSQSPYDIQQDLLFTCNMPVSNNNDVTPSGYCAQHKTAEECNSPCIWTSNPIADPHCSCDCSKITDSTICAACNSCHYDGTSCKSTKTTSFYQPPSAQTTVTLGGPFTPNPLNQDLSESPSTSLTTFTPSTSLTPTYPSYSPPSQQPQQMTTPAAARDYYNYGYSNGYSSGYYASLYSRYPYYGYNYNNNYNNYNNNYNNGYAYGGGDTVSA